MSHDFIGTYAIQKAVDGVIKELQLYIVYMYPSNMKAKASCPGKKNLWTRLHWKENVRHFSNRIKNCEYDKFMNESTKLFN